MTAEAMGRETRLVLLLAQSGGRAALETLFESVQAPLDRIDRTERACRAFFLAAAAAEALFLAGFVLLADFGNRRHVLLLLAAVATYTIVGLDLHVSRCTRRVLKAVESRDR